MAGAPSEHGTELGGTAEFALELLRRVRARGGELRICGEVVQYRPDTALTTAELDWLREHRGELVRALSAPDPADAEAFRRWLRRHFGGRHVYLGDAGPGSPAWVPAGARGRTLEQRPRRSSSAARQQRAAPARPSHGAAQ